MAKKQTRATRKTIHVHVDGNKITRIVEASGKRAQPNNLATVLWPMSPRYQDVLTNFNFPYVFHPVVFAALEAIMRNMKTVPLTIRRGTRGDANDEASQVVTAGPWNDLFGKPCPYLSQKQWLHVVFVWYDQTGDVMLIAEGKGGTLAGPKEVPVALHPFNGKEFRPEVSDNGKLLGWRTGKTIFGRDMFKPEEVVHFHRPDPRNPLTGIGVQEASAITTRSDVKAMIFDEKFLDNGCVFSGVITAENLTSDQVDQIRRQKEDEHGGYLKAFKLLALAGTGIKFTPNQVTQSDMQFKEKRLFSREEILMTRGVPESELGIGNDANIITGAGMQSSNVKLWTGAVLPLLSDFEDAIYENLFRRVDPAHFLEFDRKQIQALQPNLTASITTGKELLGMGFTANEINKRLDWGMEEIPDGSGDIRYVTAGLTPIDALTLDNLAGVPDATPPEGGDAGDVVDEPAPDETTTEPDATSKDVGTIARANVAALELLEDRRLFSNEILSVRDIVTTFMSSRKSKAREQAWRRIMKKVLIPMEAKFRRAMGSYLYSLRREQMKRIGKLDVKRTIAELCPVAPDGSSAWFEEGGAFIELDERDTIDQILFPTNEWNGKLRKATEPVYFDVIQRATDDVFTELGGNFAFDVTDPRVIEIVENRQKVNLSKVNDTIRRQTARVIEKGVRDGKTIGEIQESVRKQFDFAASRSLTIARTEVAGAANEARFEVMKEEGTEEATWSTANDEIVRTPHRENELAGPVTIGNEFPNGQKYPGDTSTGDPSDWINCFPAGVEVLTDDGPIEIQRVKHGMNVLTHGNRWMPVTELHRNRYEGDLSVVVLNGGKRLRITPSHKLFVVNRGWIDAGLLQRGDQLVNNASLASVRDAIGEIEHPHPELRKEQMPVGTQSALVVVDLDTGLELWKENVDVIVQPPAVNCHVCSVGERGDATEVLLRNDTNAAVLNPRSDDNLSRGYRSAVSVDASSFEVGSRAHSGRRLSLVGILPLGGDGFAPSAYGDIENAEGFPDGSHLGESEVVHDGSIAGTLDCISSTKKLSDRFFGDSLPSLHGVHESPEISATLRTESRITPGQLDEKLNSTVGACHVNHGNLNTLMYEYTVAHVEWESFSGMVYNLGVAEDASYFAGSVLGRNCRCVAVPA